MPAATDRIEFTPPQPPGMLRAFALALLAHALLLVALTWGVSWKRESENLAVEAELWSSIPQQAAPKPVEVQPPPPPPKVIEPPKPPPPVVRQADIAVEKEKKKPELVKKEPPPVKKPVEPPKKPDDTRAKAEEARKLEAALRQENLRRIAGMAGATGAETATGTSQRAAGPSAGYAGRIRARIKPNIVFMDDIPGNPTAEVEVRTSPDGTIIGRRLLKSSGEKSWDEAVLKAIDKTEVLPRDTDGRVPTPLIISFRPKD